MRKPFLLFSFMVLFLLGAWSQAIVTGVVTDGETGSGLEGVTVLVKGTTVGVFTDVDGKYTIKVPEGKETLIFSFVGKFKQEVALNGQTSISVTLATSDATLDEVVVTALGITREKKTLGYATQEVGGDEVTKVKDVNFINSLSGKIAGVTITRPNTMGGSANVVVRGYKSLTNNNQALFVVDGIILSNDNTNSSNQRTGRGGYDYGNAAMDINPDDIESINVLKGAAASALYGSRAANGVIVITTKKGTKRKGIGVSASFGGTYGQVDQTTMPTYQKEYGVGYGAFYSSDDGYFDFFDFGQGEGLTVPTYEDASYGAKFDPNVMVYDWKSFYPELTESYGKAFPHVAAANDASNSFYQTSAMYNTNVAIDGGNDLANFRLSYTNLDQSGIMPNSKLTRNSVNLSAGFQASPKLKVTSAVSFTATDGRGRSGTGYDQRNPNQSFRQWYHVNTDILELKDAYERTGKNITWNPQGPNNTANPGFPSYFDNYYFVAYNNYSTDARNRTYGNIQLDYKITDWLSFMGRMATDRYAEVQEERIAIGSIDVSEYNRYNRSYSEDNLDLILSADKSFGKISINGLVGTNIRRTNIASIYAETNGGLVVPNLYSFSNTVSPINAPSEYQATIATNGFFARASLGYNDFLYLDLTARQDYASTLPTGANDFFYPSASLSFVFSELMNTAGNFTFGKVRLNFAQVGNLAPAYSVYNVYGLNTPYNGISLAGLPNRRNNPELKSERTDSYEAGLELNFFQNRVGLDVSAYKSNTFNQIIPVTVTAATGFTSIFKNAGNIQNLGTEVTLRLVPVKLANFQWTVTANWAKNVNKVIELFEGQTNLQLASLQGGVTINATVGEAYGSIWGSNFVYGTDANGDKSPIVGPYRGGVRYLKDATPQPIGNINPDWRGGINNSFKFKDLTFSFLIDMQKGGNFFSLDSWYGYATGLYDITAGTNANGVETRALPANGGGIIIPGAISQKFDDQGKAVLDANGLPTSDGTANTLGFFASDYRSAIGYVNAPNAYHIYDASFVKLREVNLTYSLPKSVISKTPVQGVDFSVVGRNLWIIFKNSPYSDPEGNLSAGNVQGYQSGVYPAVKELGFNVRVRF